LKGLIELIISASSDQKQKVRKTVPHMLLSL